MSANRQVGVSARCQSCGADEICVRPTAREAGAISTRLRSEVDARWLCDACDSQRVRGWRLSEALLKLGGVLRGWPSAWERAIRGAALSGSPISLEVIGSERAQDVLWTLGGHLWRIDESGRLADVDDRPGPMAPETMTPAHPWSVAGSPESARWMALLAEYKRVAPAWQWEARPSWAALSSWINKKLDGNKIRLDTAGWRDTDSDMYWPPTGQPLLRATCTDEWDGRRVWRVVTFVSMKSKTMETVLEKSVAAQDQVVLWAMLERIGARPGREMGAS